MNGLRKIKMTAWVCICALGLAAQGADSSLTNVPPILETLQAAAAAALAEMDVRLARAADDMSTTGLTGKNARGILGQLCKINKSVIDCITIDADGKIITAEPAPYRKHEGVNIGAQAQVQRLHRTKKPVMSDMFRAVEGMEAVDLEHPVFSADSNLLGSVSVLFNPEVLFATVLAPIVRGLPVDVWVMQKNGIILFDADTEEIGRNLMDDPAYQPFPELMAAAKKMGAEESGTVTYQFPGQDGGKKLVLEAHWKTLARHGTEWRLVVAKIQGNAKGDARRTPAQLGLATHAEALRALAGSPQLQAALATGREAEVKALLKQFYEAHPDLYSVQWIDAGGINRYGYPPESNLNNYDLASSTAPGCQKILAAFKARRESAFEDELIDGRTGRFFLAPVGKAGKFLGMIYFIRIVP